VVDLVKRFLEHRDGIFGFILALARDREAAEEVFQEVGLAVVQEFGRGTDVQRFLPWVHEIARRRVAAHFRRVARGPELATPASLEDVVSQAFEEHAGSARAVAARQEYLKLCLEELPPTQRAMIEQHYTERAPIARIAESLAWSAGAVKVALWKARRRLEACIDGKVEAARHGE
jgi:RNA polymerase sigma-70 factor, ECF subfamily